MAELLVTGGAGFIGANFVRHWRATHPGDRVCVIDLLTYAGNPASLEGLEGVDLVVGDIRDSALVEGLLRERRIDRLVHFAAESHVDRSISGPDAFVSTNIEGTHALLKAARKVWLDGGLGRPHRFHHVSTDEVYGSLGPTDPPSCETSPYAPNSPYAASKAASDHLVRAYHRTYGLETTTSHGTNTYGPFQFPEKLIPLICLHCLEGRPLPIYGDGMNRREWLQVGDHCRGITAILDQGRPGEVYAIGGGAELPNMAVVEAVCAALDAAFAAEPALARTYPQCPAARGESVAALKNFVPDRPGHDRRYAIDDGKIVREIGHAPQCGFAEGIAATVHWYLANKSWWRPLLSRR